MKLKNIKPNIQNFKPMLGNTKMKKIKFAPNMGFIKIVQGFFNIMLKNTKPKLQNFKPMLKNTNMKLKNINMKLQNTKPILSILIVV